MLEYVFWFRAHKANFRLFGRGLKESIFFFKFFVKLNTQNSHRKCHRIVKTYHSQVVCDGGERVVLGLIYKLWLFVFQLFERV